MKKIIIAAVLAVAGYLIWTSPIVGQWIYANASDAEASMYGLEQQSIDIGELTIEAYVGGPETAPAIVMIHGYSADKDVWPRFAKHFVDDYRVVIPDLAGHGDTGFDPAWDYSAPAQARRVALLMDQLNIEKAHIIGNSMGGFITGWFARLFPERSLSATPVDPGGIASPVPSDMEVMLAEGKNPFLIQSTEDFERFYPMTMAKPPFLPPSVLAAMAEQYMARKPELDTIFPYIHGRDGLLTELPKITSPVLVMWGDHDRLLHVSAGRVWVDNLPNGRLHVFEGIGHMPMVEVPADTADVYRQFLNSL